MSAPAQYPFANTREISILRATHRRRRFLVVIRAGSNERPSLFTTIPDATRNYDILLNYFSPPHPRDAYPDAADYLVAGGLSKFQAAKQFLHAGYLDKYEGVYFLDDDIELHFDLSEFLAYCSEKRFPLAQAALSPQSDGAWRITFRHPGFEYRLTNFVEVMAPYMSADFLMTVAESFDMSISTYGLDVFWGSQLEANQSAAIVDRFQMSHLKKRDLAGGAFYAYLQSIGIDCFAELKAVMASLGLSRYEIRLKGGVEIVETVRTN